MAQPEISETQFVFAFLRELYERRRANYLVLPFGRNFLLPSAVEEKEVAADFLIRNFSHSEYYQFKRCDSLKGRRGHPEVKANLPKSYLPYYRFKIYNKETVSKKTGVTKKGQFEKLIELTDLSPNDRVYYCAPCFHTQAEFINLFYKNDVIGNSILINCRQFNNVNFKPPKFNINDGDEHYLIFKLNTTQGYLCSNALEISLENENLLERPLVENHQRFDDYVNKLFYAFYLDDTLTNESTLIPNQREQSSDLLQRIRIIQNYLLVVYDIIWNPLFINNNG